MVDRSFDVYRVHYSKQKNKLKIIWAKNNGQKK